MSEPTLALDRFLPTYDVRSAHQILVHADLEQTRAALLAADIGASPLVRTLVWIRSCGRVPPRLSQVSLLENLKQAGFFPLAIHRYEMVFGIAGRFWLPVAERVPLASVEDFVQFEREGYAKAAWNLCVEAVDSQTTRLRTQTRVVCFGSAAKRRFRAYWMLVGPFSGIIRMVLLRQVKRAAESPAAPAPLS